LNSKRILALERYEIERYKSVVYASSRGARARLSTQHNKQHITKIIIIIKFETHFLPNLSRARFGAMMRETISLGANERTNKQQQKRESLKHTHKERERNREKNNSPDDVFVQLFPPWDVFNRDFPSGFLLSH